MINLRMLQAKVHVLTKSMGYKHDKKNSIEAFKRELKEFKNSTTQDNKSYSENISNISSDKGFKYAYETIIKGTNEDELPDLVIVVMSHCQENNIDLETILKNKIRYNRLRDKKPSKKRAFFKAT